MWSDTWSDEYAWSSVKFTPGVCRLRLPVPDSNSKNFPEQQALLLPSEEATPVALAATTLLCHLNQTGNDLLASDWTHCAEALPGEGRVVLAVGGGSRGRLLGRQPPRPLVALGCRKS